MATVIANDDYKILSKVFIYGENLPISWNGNQEKSKMWRAFPSDTRDKMTVNDISIHVHDYSIKTDTYFKC